MINTGEKSKSTYSDLIKSNTITIISDINSANRDEIFNIFSNSILYIDKKFDMPTNNNEIISGRSNTISKVNNKLTTINNEVLNHKSQLFTSESQFRNFKIKILFWCYNQFKDVIDALDTNKNCVIAIYNTPSKHEQIFIKWLAEFGASIIIVSSDLDIPDKPEYKVNRLDIGTNEHLEYSKEHKESKSNTSTSQYKSINDIETALYKNNEVVKVNVVGIDNYDEACNFYGKLYIQSSNNSSSILITNGFSKPSYEQTSKIPRLSKNNSEYITTTLCNFISISNKDIEDKLKEAFKIKFKSAEYKDISDQQLYNKCVYAICILNNIFSTNDINKITYYGCPSNNDCIILSILTLIDNISLIIACSDKNKHYKIDNIETLTLSSSTEIFPIPMVDKRDQAFTMAAQAQVVVNKILFSGETLGMYKIGQLRKCHVKHFNTTYDELKLWWNKDMYIRPGFEADGDTVTLPTVFKIVKGVPDKNKYFNEVEQYCCGKTIICKSVSEIRSLCSSNFCQINHGTDIKGTSFKSQKPFYENGKLNRDRIKTGINFKYYLLEWQKQDLVLDAIEDVINNNKIDKSEIESTNVFIDTVLNLGLNLSTDVLQAIQWFKFYTYNPNIVVTITQADIPDIHDVIILSIMQNLGFDILLFVPTCYSTIENFAGNKLMYDTDIIGEAEYDIDLSRLYISDNIEITDSTNEKPKKHGILKWFLN